MAYCIGANVNTGLVFVSDSRTNAGIDHLGVHSKMHSFTDLRENANVSLATVQPHARLHIYAQGNCISSAPPVHIAYAEDHPYLRMIRESWAINLRRAFDELPAMPMPETNVRALDGN